MKKINQFIVNLENAIELFYKDEYDDLIERLYYPGFYDQAKQDFINDGYYRISSEYINEFSLNEKFYSEAMNSEEGYFRSVYFSQTRRYQYFFERTYYCALALFKKKGFLQSFQFLTDISIWLSDDTSMGGKNVDFDIVRLIIDNDNELFGRNFISISDFYILKANVVAGFSKENNFEIDLSEELLVMQCRNLRLKDNLNSLDSTFSDVDTSKPDWYTQENNSDWDDAPSNRN